MGSLCPYSWTEVMMSTENHTAGSTFDGGPSHSKSGLDSEAMTALRAPCGRPEHASSRSTRRGRTLAATVALGLLGLLPYPRSWAQQAAQAPTQPAAQPAPPTTSQPAVAPTAQGSAQPATPPNAAEGASPSPAPRPAAKAVVVPGAPCLVAQFKTLALDTHDPTQRERVVIDWLRRNLPGCSLEKLTLIGSNRASWLGTADSATIMGKIETAIEARVQDNPALLQQLFDATPRSFAPSVETIRTEPPRPIVGPSGGLGMAAPLGIINLRPH